VRDSLSVLDQLIGGAEGQHLSYVRTVELLGFTPAALLDDIVDAIADSDGAALFGVVDSVIDAGLDPERFMKDLLERFRDLVIVAAVEDAFESRLVGGSDDQRSRLQLQADRIGLAALTRCTELVATGIADMKGPTPPRLHLELVSAKLLLPGAHDDELSLAARLDRIERRMSIPGPAEPTEVPAGRAAPQRVAPVRGSSAPPPTAPAVAPPRPEAPASEPEASAEVTTETVPVRETGSNVSEVHELRRMWPNVLDKVKDYRRVTWAQLFEKSDVLGVDDKQLQIGLRDVGAHRAFSQGGHDEIVRQALIDVVGLDLVVVAVLDPSVAGSGKAPEPAPVETASPTTPPPAAAEARAAAAAVDRPVVGKERSTDVDDDEVALDDADADDAGLAGPELIAQQLGGTVIGEIDHH